MAVTGLRIVGMSLSREIDGSRRSRSEGCRRRGGISILIRRGANTTVQLPQGRRKRESGRVQLEIIMEDGEENDVALLLNSI